MISSRDILIVMRYLRKFTGDQITEDDICPLDNELRIDIPEVEIRPVKTTEIPIKVETRDSISSINRHSNRIFSSSLFNLVPEASPKKQSSTSRLHNRALSKDENKNKLTGLCKLKYDGAESHHVLKKESYDYTDIIQYYEENSPFNRPVDQHHALTSVPHCYEGSDNRYTENENISSSDNNSIVSSTLSFSNSHEDSTPSRGHSQERVVGNGIHARDSIPYLRNYDGAPHSYLVATNMPPVLPPHTVNVVERDSYYRSKTTSSSSGEPIKSISAAAVVADNSVYTRKPRVYRKRSPMKHMDDKEEHFFPYQPSGYHGNLRVIN